VYSLRLRHVELDLRELLRRLADLAQERQPARVGVDLVEQVIRHDLAEAGVAVLDRLVEPLEGLRPGTRRTCRATGGHPADAGLRAQRNIAAAGGEIFCDGGCFAKFLVRKQLHDARNRPTDATVRIDSWVVASYRTCDNRSTAPNQL
jgi:hypothetical protein